MSEREAPKVDSRRAADFRAELTARARAWIHGWSLEESTGDFGEALMDIAARFSAQVAERLDRAGEKLSLGLLDWLAVRGKAATPARMPVAFKLADAAREPVLARKPVRLQADVDGASVVFETETDVNLVPGTLAQLVGVDAAGDAYFLPPPGISSLEPLEPLPNRWVLKNFVDQGATKLQLDPALGLTPGMLIEIGSNQYRITKADGDLVEIEPGLQNVGGLGNRAEATRVVKFDPFGGNAHNEQEHALYLGDKDVLNLEAAATIEVIGASTLRDATWEFWGKAPGGAELEWQRLTLPGFHPAGSVLLYKPAGPIELREIGDSGPNRWIRARVTQVRGVERRLNVNELKLVINRGNDQLECTEINARKDPGAQAEGFANSTPLAFSSVFYPLGREPKQFDTFYLGCTDAFSKKSAKVAICFELADASTTSFSTVGTGWLANYVLGSIAQDSALHLYQLDTATGDITRFRNRDPLQPPKPSIGSAAAEGAPIALVNKPKWRPPMWSMGSFLAEALYVAVSAGAAVWVWKEFRFGGFQPGWISFGSIVGNPPADAQVTGLVCVSDGTPTLFATLEGTLYSHSALEADAAASWDEIKLKDGGGNPLDGALQTIGPVKTDPGTANSWSVGGIVGVVRNTAGRDHAYAIDAAGVCTALDNTFEVKGETIPSGIEVGGTTYYFWQQKSPANVIRAVDGAASKASIPLGNPPDQIIGYSFEVLRIGLDASVVAVGTKGEDSWLIRWSPFAAPNDIYSQTKLPPGSGPLAGAPTVLTNFVAAPGGRGDVWLSRWQPELRLEANATDFKVGIVVDSIGLLSTNDLLLIDNGTGNPPDTAVVKNYAGSSGGKSLYTLLPDATPTYAFGVNNPDPRLIAFRVADLSVNFTGTKGAADDKLQLDPGDIRTTDGDWIAILVSGTYEFCTLTRDLAGLATLSDTVLAGSPGPFDYIRGVALTARIAPHFALLPPVASKLSVDDLVGTPFVFKTSGNFVEKFAESFVVIGGHPTLVGLKDNWSTLPTGGAMPHFTFDATTASWRRQLEAPTSDPQLIWEFWNGSGWSKLELDGDETQDFTSSGRLRFTVPALLTSTDVSGKTNFWVRARLIVGDYGRETITAVTVTKPSNITEQTIVRDTSDFHPPLVLTMRIRYALDTAIHPEAVWTQDSGSWRDQSAANAAPGAFVEGFVPLSLLMRRLAHGPALDIAPDTAGCACGEAAATEPAPVTATGDESGTAKPASNDYALLFGFDAGLIGEPVNVLLLVDERNHDGFAPLAVEALTKDRFEALTVKDTTRALGESGVLAMAFAVKPSPRDLFGRTLTWLRLQPSRIDPNASWRPIIRGAYLNAAWASATETLTREPLGSSDGRPGLTLRVARPPLLQDTLELRVREPLDEEERKALIDVDTASMPDAKIVKFDIPDLPGNWVLWKQVADPADCGPHERVYALDEALGEVTFGDGIHGMIPPIGRDAVVAFSYQRTELAADGGDGVPANGVKARATLNLVTPVESVEAAFAADDAAGGAPPESTARVKRFGSARLRHRGRAMVARDFEDLALASSPDIVQARAVKRVGALRVVVVMRGEDPTPNAGQRRELRRLLQESASPLLGDTAITIVGPRVRKLRLRLALRVASLDDAGDVAGAVKDALHRFFDSGTGGVNGEGWPLGAGPAEDDIAFALADVQDLEGIAQITLIEIDANGGENVWRPSVRTDELVMLADDALRIDFETLEAQA